MNDRLGRGLGALIPDNDLPAKPHAGLSTLPIEQIKPNKYQPRKTFDPEKLTELAESIKENGIIQPLIVTKSADSEYELIAGERRLQAAKLAGLDLVPVVIRSVSKKEQLQLAIIENVQREDLNPMEEALAYKVLAEDFELTHKDIARIMSKERTTITNSIRLLNLPREVQDQVSLGRMSPGQARAVLSLEPEHQSGFAEFVLKYNLTVRQAEEKAKTWVEQQNLPTHKPEPKSSLIRSLEHEIRGTLQIKATIRDNQGKGKITLQYDSPEELERLRAILLSR
ncbi:MAG TPA: ParB/RepB/Spo0J family partition protein [Candidatus Cloacimonadota bacterium]|nr:ParB/RepB/Spo0J family partition protein [Candidatus Cloacimonadota bacterium]HPS38597.1 ParB/RepB/Spo0J family partition protein [Candidatus Cloacimonadota bacterium]